MWRGFCAKHNQTISIYSHIEICEGHTLPHIRFNSRWPKRRVYYVVSRTAVAVLHKIRVLYSQVGMMLVAKTLSRRIERCRVGSPKQRIAVALPRRTPTTPCEPHGGVLVAPQV